MTQILHFDHFTAITYATRCRHVKARPTLGYKTLYLTQRVTKWLWFLLPSGYFISPDQPLWCHSWFLSYPERTVGGERAQPSSWYVYSSVGLQRRQTTKICLRCVRLSKLHRNLSLFKPSRQKLSIIKTFLNCCWCSPPPPPWYSIQPSETHMVWKSQTPPHWIYYSVTHKGRCFPLHFRTSDSQ